MGKTTKIENAYEFITNSQAFTIEELEKASGWTHKTAEKSLWKIGDMVEKDGQTYTPIPNFAKKISLTKFKEAFSQTRLRKNQSLKIERLLEKSKNSVLSAVQMYNNPLTTFRTESFIVLMTIGYTSLFHAIFEKNGWAYSENNGYLYGLEKCFNVFMAKPESQKYESIFLKSLDALLKYFKNARDLIEHQLNEIDDYTYGHCQSWLFCYEHLLRTEFSIEHSLNTFLASAIQFTNSFVTPQKNTTLDDFHMKFYSTLSSDVKDSPFFKLKIRIIPYKNITDEDLRQNAIFVSDPKIAAKYAEMDKAIFVTTPKNIPPTEMTDLVRPSITAKYGNIKFTASHLAKVAIYMKWVKDGKIINKTFVDYVTLGKHSKVRQYKEGAEREIEKQMNKNPDAFLKSFAPKSFYENWKQVKKEAN